MNKNKIIFKLDNGIPLTSKEAKELLDIIKRLEKGAPTVEEIKKRADRHFTERFNVSPFSMPTIEEVDTWWIKEIITLQSHHEEEMNRAVESYIKDVLLDFHKSQLDGKGYDFFFKLKTDLDALQSTPITDKQV